MLKVVNRRQRRARLFLAHLVAHAGAQGFQQEPVDFGAVAAVFDLPFQGIDDGVELAVADELTFLS